jgi:aerobic carbon-monoxide dehydrogenase medium subunit
MLPRSFEYVSPGSVDEAIALLGEYGENAKLLAGGQSLIPLMKLRLASPKVVVDLNRIPGLAGIREEGNAVAIGAMTRHRDIERSAPLRALFPLLADAAPLLADPLVRNRGTVGGSLAHADPASDWAVTFLALDAELEVQGPKGKRSVGIGSFFRDSFSTALGANDVITQVRLPKPAPHTGSGYAKLKRKTGDFATVAAAAVLRIENDLATHVRVSLGGVAPTPIRSARAEQALVGKAPDPARIAAAARAAAEEARPTDDLRGTAEYKRAMVAVYVARALSRSLERAHGRSG